MNIISRTAFGWANSYIITKDGKHALVVDPYRPELVRELERLNITPTHVLLTHCHFDHVGGVAILQELGAQVYCFVEEKPLVGTDMELGARFGIQTPAYTVDGTFADGEEKILSDISVTALHTPGHTKGSCCYLVKDGENSHLFTGDTLFMDSIGRTDFPTGSVAQMRASLKRLVALDDMPIYPGHNEESTLGREKKYNLFIKDAE